MYIHQYLIDRIEKFIKPNKAIIIFGPRRVGKTTLINKYLESVKESYLLLQGDDIFVRETLKLQSINHLKNLVGKHKLLVVDEAQKVKDVGTVFKILLDNIKGIKIIATGSSSFDLAREIGEPLTGRKFTFRLYPLSQMEIKTLESPVDTKANLEQRLIFGSYPEVVLAKSTDEKITYLRELVSSYLYKDILEIEGIKHSDKISKLLQLLALQIGQLVSYTELGTALGLSKNTVERYIDLLEKSFVIFQQTGFSRNLRKEIIKSPKYYFWDLGIRNALINNFNPLTLRTDDGFLWQNYIICERMKKQEYEGIHTNNYFWRTYDKQEIDLVEERNGKLFSYEIKLGKSKVSVPKAWKENYPGASFEVINKNNYLSFIS